MTQIPSDVEFANAVDAFMDAAYKNSGTDSFAAGFLNSIVCLYSDPNRRSDIMKIIQNTVNSFNA